MAGDQHDGNEQDREIQAQQGPGTPGTDVTRDGLRGVRPDRDAVTGVAAGRPRRGRHRRSPPKSSSPIRFAGSSRNRASRSASAVPMRRNSCTGPRTGGKVGEERPQERLAQHVPATAQIQPRLGRATAAPGRPATAGRRR